MINESKRRRGKKAKGQRARLIRSHGSTSLLFNHWTAILMALFCLSGCTADFWFTPDQRGQRLMKAGKFMEAANVFTDPFRQGEAFYRAGEFEAARAAFSRTDSSEAHFNRGNSLVMLGKYTDAVEAYDRAAVLRPGWKEAGENREIARLRAERTKVEGGDMTGGMLGADEIVFDEGGEKPSDGKENVQSDAGRPLTDEQIRSLWLRRVQTKPADFLRTKFAYQHARAKNRLRP